MGTSFGHDDDLRIALTHSSLTHHSTLTQAHSSLITHSDSLITHHSLRAQTHSPRILESDSLSRTPTPMLVVTACLPAACIPLSPSLPPSPPSCLPPSVGVGYPLCQHGPHIPWKWAETLRGRRAYTDTHYRGGEGRVRDACCGHTLIHTTGEGWGGCATRVAGGHLRT